MKPLNTLNRQSLVRNSDVKIVVLDSGSRDSTVEKAKEAADEVWSVPKGKLSARHTGLLRSNADIEFPSTPTADTPKDGSTKS